MKPESLHWADKIANEVEQRISNEPVLKRIVKEKGYIVYDEKTPSGKIHIGSGRGWIIHDTITKALRDKGLKGRFILSSDDIDPYDKPNKELPSFNKYLGMPFRNIPSPIKGYESFADYYFRQCTDKFGEFGIQAELESTGERYIKGDFNKAIKIILNNSKKIDEIYRRFYGKPLGKLPFNPICEKCGKIGTTLAYEWDKEREIIKYRCESNFVKWAKGCGNKGEISPYNGNGKLPWKVEWAAKWPTVGVVCELAGKDHFTKGGSRSIAVAISNEILDFPPPYPSTRDTIGSGYEFFTVGGKKMSTSKGMGVGFAEITDYIPADVLRYLLVATRPRAVIDFDPYRKNDLVLLHERYDKTERIYYGKEKLDNLHEIQKHKRIYELAHIGKIGKVMPPQISLAHAAIILQITLTEEKALEMLKKSGHIPEKYQKDDIEYVKNRLRFARLWLDKYAPEEFKFKVQETPSPNINLNEKQKKALQTVADLLKTNKFTEKELHNRFYEICKEINLNSEDFFRVAYLVLLNKERGPRLASFILTIGVKRVVSLFEKV